MQILPKTRRIGRHILEANLVQILQLCRGRSKRPNQPPHDLELTSQTHGIQSLFRQLISAACCSACAAHAAVTVPHPAAETAARAHCREADEALQMRDRGTPKIVPRVLPCGSDSVGDRHLSRTNHGPVAVENAGTGASTGRGAVDAAQQAAAGHSRPPRKQNRTISVEPANVTTCVVGPHEQVRSSTALADDEASHPRRRRAPTRPRRPAVAREHTHSTCDRSENTTQGGINGVI